MKKAVIVGFIIVLLLLMSSVDLFGHKRRYRPTDNYLTFTFVVNPSGLGYKHHLAKNIYFTGDLDYRQERADLPFLCRRWDSGFQECGPNTIEACRDIKPASV